MARRLGRRGHRGRRVFGGLPPRQGRRKRQGVPRSRGTGCHQPTQAFRPTWVSAPRVVTPRSTTFGGNDGTRSRRSTVGSSNASGYRSTSCSSGEHRRFHRPCRGGMGWHVPAPVAATARPSCHRLPSGVPPGHPKVRPSYDPRGAEPPRDSRRKWPNSKPAGDGGLSKSDLHPDNWQMRPRRSGAPLRAGNGTGGGVWLGPAKPDSEGPIFR